MTIGKTIALTRWTFVGKVISLLFKMLFRLVITFLPRNKRLLISWLQSLSAVILESKKRKSVTVLQEGAPFQGPKLGSCLTLGNELSEETHVLTKQETLSVKGARGESRRVREPRRTALPCGSQCWALW